MKRWRWRRPCCVPAAPQDDPAAVALKKVTAAIEARACSVLRGAKDLCITPPSCGAALPAGDRNAELSWRCSSSGVELWCRLAATDAAALLACVLGAPGAQPPTVLERRILAETMARLLAYGDDLWEEELSFAPTSEVWESAIELCVPGGARVRIVVAAMPFDASARSAKRAVRLEAVPLRLDAMLQPVRMPIAAMLRWSPGELVPLASARTPHVSLWAGRLRVAQGILGASGPRRAVAVHHIELDDGAAS